MKSFSSDLFIVLRLHPKNNNEEFSDYYKEFDQISIKESAYEIIFFSDYVIGMTSMLMTEALIMGKPTFSILVKESEKNCDIKTIVASVAQVEKPVGSHYYSKNDRVSD